MLSFSSHPPPVHYPIDHALRDAQNFVPPCPLGRLASFPVLILRALGSAPVGRLPHTLALHNSIQNRCRDSEQAIAPCPDSVHGVRSRSHPARHQRGGEPYRCSRPAFLRPPRLFVIDHPWC